MRDVFTTEVEFPTLGNIFFVNGISGADTNNGKLRSTPFLTIEHALDRCVDDNDDVIYVVDCWQQDTFPIAINKSRVHIIGLDNWNGMYPRMTPPDDRAIFEIDTDGYIELAHFGLGAGANHAAIEFVGTVSEGRSYLHDLWLGHCQTAQDGIKVIGGKDAPECLIERCIFGNMITRDGVRIEHNSTRTIIRDNIFRRVGGIGIQTTLAGADIGAILNNVFSLDDDGAGEAITLAAATSGCLIDNNHAAAAGADPANNPYVDNGTNDWGLNYKGITATYPV